LAKLTTSCNPVAEATGLHARVAQTPTSIGDSRINGAVKSALGRSRSARAGETTLSPERTGGSPRAPDPAESAQHFPRLLNARVDRLLRRAVLQQVPH